MLLYRLTDSAICVRNGQAYSLPGLCFDTLFSAEDPAAWLESQIATASPCALPDHGTAFLPPMGSQEVWAAGVTYQRSKVARMDESKEAGASVFYDRVYEADRPEIFFKATAPRVRGHRAQVRVRSDSTWSVPEPELTLAINAAGRIFGFTIGNDMSARDIEGENPLYLPQAKTYRGSCSLGPALLIAPDISPDAAISITITRSGQTAFSGTTAVSQLKRTLPELAGWLFRDNEFSAGALLLTGTGIVPQGTWTLQSGDEIAITIDGIGTLVNAVE